VTDALQRGAVVLRAGGRLAFLPAHAARRVVPMPPVARIAGAPPHLLGLAVVEGTILPVVSVGAARGVLLVYGHGDHLVGLVGIEVLATGVFDVPSPGVLTFEGGAVPELDLSWLDELGRPLLR
jgi:hypothetical protein